MLYTSKPPDGAVGFVGLRVRVKAFRFISGVLALMDSLPFDYNCITESWVVLLLSIIILRGDVSD